MNNTENNFENLTHINIYVPVSVSSLADCSDKKRVEEIAKDSIAVWQHSICDMIAELGLELLETSEISERRCDRIGERLTFFTTLNKGLIESLENMDVSYHRNYKTFRLREVRPNTTLPELLAEVMNHPSIDADLWNKLNELLPDTMIHSPELIKQAIQPEKDALDLSEFSPEDLDSKLSEIGNGELLNVLNALAINPNVPKKVSTCIAKEIENFPT